MPLWNYNLPPGCGTLPGEESGAYEMRIDGVWYAWDEDDNIFKQDPHHPQAREDGYVFFKKLQWPDDPEVDAREVMYNAIKGNRS